MQKTRVLVIGAVAAGIALSGAACSSSSGTKTSASNAAAASPAAPVATASTASAPFGPGCSAVPTTGKGSFSGMATAPVATAASANPALSTLVTAVKKAGLVDTLNSAPALTVFAPDNAAFAKIPKATLTKILGDKKMLTSILTYHVTGGKHAPADLASGSFKSLEGGMLTTSGSGDAYKVNGASNVVCGNVQTANATVYIIDTVLSIPKS